LFFSKHPRIRINFAFVSRIAAGSANRGRALKLIDKKNRPTVSFACRSFCRPVGDIKEEKGPVSMLVRPEGGDGLPSNHASQRLDREVAESFEAVLARVMPLTPNAKQGGFWKRLFSSASSTQTKRTVAFDGFRNDLYDEKVERDRRYGTVYTVSEQKKAYLVRLEMPRRLASSALRATWNLPAEMPDYDYTITLEHNVLTIRASVPGEALRRLSYISTSFPADFMTQIEFTEPVKGFVQRLRTKVLEIIVLKTVSAQLNARGEPAPASPLADQ
jgi:hypothetical protein